MLADDAEYVTLVTPSGGLAATQRVRVAFSDMVPSGAVWACHAGVFSSRHERTWRVELRENARQALRLERNNPFFHEAALAKLDEHGVVRPGITVRHGDVLVSVLAAKHPFVRRAVAGKQWATDDSLFVPETWDQAMVADARVIRKRGAIVAAEVTLRRDVLLEIGDWLMATRPQDEIQTLNGDTLLAKGYVGLGVVSRLVAAEDWPAPPETLLLASSGIASHFDVPAGRSVELCVGKGEPAGPWIVRSFTTGPYSLISRQPLIREDWRPQLVPSAACVWLAERGLHANLAELTSLKCDDVGNRERVRAAVTESPRAADAPPIPAAGAPDSLRRLRLLLQALGLLVDFHGDPEHLSIGLRPGRREELISLSSGVVTKAETVHYRTLQPQPGGLLCAETFQYTDLESWGIDETRPSFAMGRVELADEFVPLLWRLGQPSLLERLLALPSERIESILRCETWVVADGEEVQFPSRQPAESVPANAPEATAATGAAAIRRLLAAVPLERWPQGLIDRRDVIIQDVLLVPPPDMRPLVLLDSGNFATADINDLYRLVINYSNRLAKLKQLNAPATILFAGQAELQHILDAVMFNSLLPDDRAFFAEGSDKRLVSLGEMLLDLPNQRRPAEVSKPVAWSGRSRAVIDPALAAGHVGIPAELCDRLGLRDGDIVLLMSSVGKLPDDGESFGSAACVTVAGRAIRVTAETYRRLRLDLADQGACVVHRPLGQKAMEEARQLVSAVPPADSRRVAAATWLDANDVTEFAAGLIGAAIHGYSAPLNSPRGLLVAGVCGAQFSAPSGRGQAESAWREVDAPPPPPPPSTDKAAVFRDIRDVIERQLRRACVFDIARAMAPSSATPGRIGGAPLLPVDVPWPLSRGKPLRFIAQLPLTYASETGIGEFLGGSDSLLTIFWDDRYELPRCSVGEPICVVSAARSVPRELQSESLCSAEEDVPAILLNPELVSEVPAWSEVVEILHRELGRLDERLLQAFQREEWPAFPHPSPLTKLGGWPHWIQEPSFEGRFLAQLSGTHGLFDGGMLYIFQGRERLHAELHYD